MAKIQYPMKININNHGIFRGSTKKQSKFMAHEYFWSSGFMHQNQYNENAMNFPLSNPWIFYMFVTMHAWLLGRPVIATYHINNVFI